MKKETGSIRNQIPRTKYREHSSPIFMTSSFVFDSAEQARALFAEEQSGDIYSRYSNPNTTELVDKLVKMEKADDGLVFSSGMAAIFAALAGLLNSGDHIVASRSLFGSSVKIMKEILPRWGIQTSFVDIDKNSHWEQAVQSNTRVLFTETPSNPALDLCDLEFLGSLKKEKDLVLIVDNSFATPALQNPIDFGADLVAHSTTKLIDGQGRTIGGALVGGNEPIAKVRAFARNTGPTMSAFNAWLLSKSLETLNLRVEKHCNNAKAIATHFTRHSKVLQVKYPTLPTHPQRRLAENQMLAGGGMVALELEGGLERAMTFIDKTEMVSSSSNLGDTRTIVTHPTTTTHSSLTEDERLAVGITPGLVRISVGLEHVDDIIADLERALDQPK